MLPFWLASVITLSQRETDGLAQVPDAASDDSHPDDGEDDAAGGIHRRAAAVTGWPSGGGAEQLRAGEETRLAVARIRERNRVARELHDVVAHGVSVMVVQAGLARITRSGRYRPLPTGPRGAYQRREARRMGGNRRDSGDRADRGAGSGAQRGGGSEFCQRHGGLRAWPERDARASRVCFGTAVVRAPAGRRLGGPGWSLRFRSGRSPTSPPPRPRSPGSPSPPPSTPEKGCTGIWAPGRSGPMFC